MSSTEVYRIEIPITVEDNYTEEIQKAEKAILALQKQLGKDVCKTVEDSMEALADSKMGELERLKEFNVKLTKKEFDKIGYAGVLKELVGQFEGGAKTAKTAAGILATLQGYRGSLMRSKIS